MLIYFLLLGCATTEPGDTAPDDTGEPPDTGDSDTGETGDTGPANTPPTTPGITFTPTVPAPAVAFAVIVESPSADAEGDAVTYRYAWSQNDVAVPDLVDDAVPAERSVLGDTWVVAVTPNDGKDDGIPAQSTVTVGNTAPSARVSPCPPKSPSKATRSS